MKNQKGSLILSLVATISVAATIVVTHQVAQVFSEGVGQKFNQEQAFRLAQKNLALAALMINRGIIACSARRLTLGEDSTENETRVGRRVGRFEGCRLTDKDDQEFQGTKDLYGSKGLDLEAENGDFFKPPRGDNGKDLSLNEYGGHLGGFKSVIFNHENKNHSIFKTAKIIWAVKSLEDPVIKSAFSSLSKGFICWEKGSFKINNEGICKGYGNFHSTENHRFNHKQGIENVLVKIDDDSSTHDEECKDSDGYPISGTVCDYYSLSDYDQGLVLISVEVPYGEESDNNSITMNALVRRPPAIVKIFPKEGGSCPIMCEPSGKSVFSTDAKQSVERIDPSPRCTTMGHASYFRARHEPSGDKVGGPDFRYREGTILGPSYFTVKNYGPGPLYDLVLKREDIDNSTNNVFSHQLVSNIGFRFENGGELMPGDERVMKDWVPCYRSHYYSQNIKKVSCSYRMNRFNEKNRNQDKLCADGVICEPGAAGTPNTPTPSNTMDVFARACVENPLIDGAGDDKKGNVLYGNLAREAFTPKPPTVPIPGKFPRLVNSIRTIFEDGHTPAGTPNTSHKTRSGGNITYSKHTCERETDESTLAISKSAMGFKIVRPAQTDVWMKKRWRY